MEAKFWIDDSFNFDVLWYRNKNNETSLRLEIQDNILFIYVNGKLVAKAPEHLQKQYEVREIQVKEV